MEERTHGWHYLRDHATPPPREVFDNLRQLLDPSAGESDSAFRRLGSHSIPPPATLRSAILDSMTPGSVDRRSKSWLPYAAAAACVLLFAIGFVRYKSAHGNKPAVARNNPYSSPVVAPANTGSVAAKPSTAAVAGGPAGTTAIRISPPTLTLDGDQLALADNSPLATFTSYRYPSLGKYINSRSSETALRIHLDQFTSITLSPAMTAALRDLYDTRRDGTPSRKARKTRERLENWNREDQKEFDPHTTANPLDAVDLAEFLFPPLFSIGHHSSERLPAAALPAAAQAATAAQAEAASAQAEAASAQAASTTPPDNTSHSLPEDNNPLTISYTLTLITKKPNTGIGETYNGGIQTLFMQNGYSRLRLASLMRIQSEMMTPGAPTATILTESVKPRQETGLTPRQWLAYNGKYTGMTRSLVDDSLVILGYHCKKALISLHDGRRITAWYTPEIRQPAQARIEPVFTGIPGLVLRYEYTCRRKTIRYTATGLNRRPIDASVFTIP